MAKFITLAGAAAGLAVYSGHLDLGNGTVPLMISIATVGVLLFGLLRDA